MQKTTLVDIANGYGFNDLSEIRFEYNRMQNDCRGKSWPVEVPIPFREFQDLLEKQINVHDSISIQNPVYALSSKLNINKMRNIYKDTLATRVFQAMTLLNKSSRQYEANADLYSILQVMEWDGKLNLDLLNQMPSDCIALHMSDTEKGQGYELFWFVFRDMINSKKPVLIVVGVVPPEEGTNAWHSFTYEIPFLPGKIRDNITWNDLRLMRTRYGESSVADKDALPEQKLLQNQLDEMMDTLFLIVPIVHHICASPLDMIESCKPADIPVIEIGSQFMEIVQAVKWRHEVAALYSSKEK